MILVNLKIYILVSEMQEGTGEQLLASLKCAVETLVPT